MKPDGAYSRRENGERVITATGDQLRNPDQLRRSSIATTAQPASRSAEALHGGIRAIGLARGWLNEILRSDTKSFDEIALREGLVERHVRFLMPLAFVAPRVIEAIADGTAPADLTVTRLAKALPTKWADQATAILGV